MVSSQSPPLTVLKYLQINIRFEFSLNTDKDNNGRNSIMDKNNLNVKKLLEEKIASCEARLLKSK